mmetsp:Transcript_11734/g.45502  ORF Transcript_11734/g.45502 Transcript_11734/m.45502 type:complete len:265 (-) Transcript_11734:287-1081(-)
MPANMRGRRIVRGRRRRRRRPPLPHPGEVPAAIQIPMPVPDLATSGARAREGTPRRRESDETPLGSDLSHVAGGAARGPRRGTRARQGVDLSPTPNAQIAVGRVARPRQARSPPNRPRSLPTPDEGNGRRVGALRSRASPRPRVARVVAVPRHVRRRPRPDGSTRPSQRQRVFPRLRRVRQVENVRPRSEARTDGARRGGGGRQGGRVGRTRADAGRDRRRDHRRTRRKDRRRAQTRPLKRGERRGEASGDGARTPNEGRGDRG